LQGGLTQSADSTSRHSPLLSTFAQVAFENLLPQPDALRCHLYKLVTSNIANDIFQSEDPWWRQVCLQHKSPRCVSRALRLAILVHSSDTQPPGSNTGHAQQLGMGLEDMLETGETTLTFSSAFTVRMLLSFFSRTGFTSKSLSRAHSPTTCNVLRTQRQQQITSIHFVAAHKWSLCRI